MTDIEQLAHRLASQASSMEQSGVPPYDREAVLLSQGELNVLVRALALVAAVRGVAGR